MTDLPKPAIEAAAEIEALLSTTGYFCLGRKDRELVLATIIAKRMEANNG